MVRGPRPEGDVVDDCVENSVGDALPPSSGGAACWRGWHQRRRGEPVVEVGDDVRRIHDRDVSVDEYRNLGPAIHRVETRVLRKRQRVDRLVGDFLELERHPHLAGEGTEGVVVENDHEVSDRCSVPSAGPNGSRLGCGRLMGGEREHTRHDPRPYRSNSSFSRIRSSNEVISCSARDWMSAYAGSASQVRWISLSRDLLSYSAIPVILFSVSSK